jgi:hypothetical protein
MEVHHDEGGRLTETAELTQLQQARREPPIEHPDVLAWLAEAQRLFAEAEERFEAGRVLSALSSLAAVPPLHSMLIDRFSGIVITTDPTAPEESDERDFSPGLYL